MNDVVQSAVGQYEAIQAALTEGSALAIYLDWINLLSKRHPASLERHVRTMIKAVQRLHRRYVTDAMLCYSSAFCMSVMEGREGSGNANIRRYMAATRRKAYTALCELLDNT
ncbi:hypothetical protein R3X46_24925, partial [Salmonella enterica subsp. enterica serovar Agona]|nr:hypothetical protein [Salmonella enterica subsp. enterica serovar Agona]